jgi:hypothetical protein
MGAFVTIVISIILLVVAVERILEFADVFEKTEYRVLETVQHDFYNSTTVFEANQFAIGLQFKEEFQHKMSDSFTKNMSNYLQLRVQVKEKISGESFYQDLGIERCSTQKLNMFFDAAPGSTSSMDFARTYRQMFCLDDWAREKIKANLSGNGLNRHDDHRQIVFEVLPCKEDLDAGTCKNPNIET